MREKLECRGCKRLQQCDQSVSLIQSSAKIESSRAVGLQRPAGRPGGSEERAYDAHTGWTRGAIPGVLVLAGARLRVVCKPLYRSVCANGLVNVTVDSASRVRQRVFSVVIGSEEMRRGYEGEMVGRKWKQKLRRSGRRAIHGSGWSLSLGFVYFRTRRVLGIYVVPGYVML